MIYNYFKQVFLLSLVAAFSFSCNEKKTTVSGDILIKNIAILSPSSDSFSSPQYVLISGDSILGISSDSSAFSSTVIIDGQGKFLIPGLSEMHAHIPTPAQGGMELVEETLFLYLSQGVTTIRGMLGDPFHLELKEKIKKDEILSPRIITSGPSFNGNSAKTPKEAEKMVREQKELGYDFMKLHPGLSRETFDQIVKTGKEVGLGYSGHVSFDVGIRHGLNSGYGSIDHIDGYVEGLVPEDSAKTGVGGFFGFNFTEMADKSLIDELADLTLQNQVWVVPTQCLLERWVGPKSPEELIGEPEMKYMNPETRDRWVKSKQNFQAGEGYSQERAQAFVELRQELLNKLYKKGVGILLGSDAPQVFNVPGFSAHHEMLSMKASGIPEKDILKSGTSAPSQFFNMENEFGTIETGKSADLILLNSNPLEDIGNAQDIQGVMVRGHWLSREEINSRLETIGEKYKN